MYSIIYIPPFDPHCFKNSDFFFWSDKLQETKIKLESKGTTGAILSLNKSFIYKECKAFRSSSSKYLILLLMFSLSKLNSSLFKKSLPVVE
jgi:hypothetical protein